MRKATLTKPAPKPDRAASQDLKLAVHFLAHAPVGQVPEGQGVFGRFTAFYSRDEIGVGYSLKVSIPELTEFSRDWIGLEIKLMFPHEIQWSGTQAVWTVPKMAEGDPFAPEEERAA